MRKRSQSAGIVPTPLTGKRLNGEAGLVQGGAAFAAATGEAPFQESHQIPLWERPGSWSACLPGPLVTRRRWAPPPCPLLPALNPPLPGLLGGHSLHSIRIAGRAEGLMEFI